MRLCRAVVVLLMLPVAGGMAQRLDRLTAGVTPSFPASSPRSPLPGAAAAVAEPGVSHPARVPYSMPLEGRVPAPWSPVFSAVVPGSGQATLGLDRAMAYFALEGFVWLEYFKDRREFTRQSALFKGLAFDVARAGFGARPEGNWDYYELMEKYVASGRYNAGAASDLVPESDTTTANGQAWLLARSIYWSNVDVAPPRGSTEYQSALAFYRRRAITPEFEWSWHSASLQWDLYKRTISKRNDAAHRQAIDLSMLLANHVLSTVDAFATLRLRAIRERNGNVRVEARLPVPTPRL